MPRIVFTSPLSFSPDGYTVVRYPASAEAVEVSDRCAEVAVSAGFAHPADEAPPSSHPHTKPRARAKGKE